MKLRQALHEIVVPTKGRGMFAVTPTLREWLRAESVVDGLLTVFIKHTSASLLVQENADPSVRSDLERFLVDLVPDGDSRFTHDAEGPDDMPSHVRSALTNTQLSIPVRSGSMTLGTWQGVYVYEHRTSPHQRAIALHYFGT